MVKNVPGNINNSKKVVYASFTYEGHVELAAYLFENYGWDPVYWIGFKNYEQTVNQAFPDAFYLRNQDLRRGRFAHATVDISSIPIDKNIIEACSKYEPIALDMMLRRDTTGWNYSYVERKEFYYQLLKYWVNIIQAYRPDIFLSFVIPHSPEEYVLYRLCKYFDIPTLFVNPTPIFDTYYYIANSIEDLANVFQEDYRQVNKVQLDQETQDYLNKLKLPQGYVQSHMRQFKKRVERQDNFAFSIFFELKRLARIRLSIIKKSGSHWKMNQHPVQSEKSEMNYLQETLFKMKLRRNNMALKKIYNGFTDEMDFNQKYIYFAPNYQPEANVTPPAGIYADFYLILDILSSSIPDDWVIYYKEHPSTFYAGIEGSLSRSKRFYERLNTIKKVRFIDSNINTFELIDNSCVVATPTGTVGWEALVRDKPTLVFGQVWYVGCNSVFHIETYQDCINAVNKIRNGYKPDQRDIERYAAAVESIAEKNLMIRDFEERTVNCPNINYEMERIAKALYEAHERYYGSQESGRRGLNQ